MSIPNVPPGYQQVMPYLIVYSALDFIAFMKEVFGATDKMKHMRDENTIAHAEITIGESVIMLADVTPPYKPRSGGFFIYVADADAVYKKAVAAGCIALSPVANQPYGRSGGVEDPYGNQWWVTTVL